MQTRPLRKSNLFYLLLLLAAALCGCGRREAALERIRSAGSLTIGTDATYPPFEFVRNGEFTGYDVDLGTAIAKELGVKVRWVNTGFDGILPALVAGKFDLVMSSVTITEEREKQFDFSDPYYTAGQILAVPDASSITRLQELAGKTAGIQLNTTAAEVLKEFPQVKVRQYPTLDLALQDLENGNVDAVVGDAPTIRYFLTRSFAGLKTAGDLLSEEQYGIVMRPGEDDLRVAVNQALAKLRRSGRFAEIETRWFGNEADIEADETGELPWGRILGDLVRGLGLTLQLAVLALLLGTPLGLLMALARLARFRPLAWLAAGYVELLRGTPLLVQIIFVYYALPQLLGVNLKPLPAAILALTLNSAAYIAEIFRAGIQSIDPGQMEAARSLGMSHSLAMRCVVLPQATRRVLPPLTNEAIALLKDTSLVAIVGMAELTRTGQELVGQLALPFLVWPLVALFYLAVTFPLTRIAAGLERRWTLR